MMYLLNGANDYEPALLGYPGEEPEEFWDFDYNDYDYNNSYDYNFYDLLISPEEKSYYTEELLEFDYNNYDLLISPEEKSYYTEELLEFDNLNEFE
tara:strand:+ start:2464 stop:2751 length:288 start_codon:yes stop_codon:yes gene_type:complete